MISTMGSVPVTCTCTCTCTFSEKSWVGRHRQDLWRSVADLAWVLVLVWLWLWVSSFSSGAVHAFPVPRGMTVSLPTSRQRPFGVWKLEPSTTSTSTSRTAVASSRPERAGMSGYSVERQPLRWDVDTDPFFEPPSLLDDDDDDYGWATGTTTTKTSPTTTTGTHVAAVKMSKSSSEARLHRRTLETLDYAQVVTALADACTTAPAREIVEARLRWRPSPKDIHNHNHNHNHNDENKEDLMSLTAISPEGARRRYEATRQFMFCANQVQLQLQPPNWNVGGTALDLPDVLDVAVKERRVLDGPRVSEVSDILQALINVASWRNALETYHREKVEATAAPPAEGDTWNEHKDDWESVDELLALTSSLDVPMELHQLLSEAFEVVEEQKGKVVDDDPNKHKNNSQSKKVAVGERTGRLSSKAFPELGVLRQRVRTLKRGILSTLDGLLSGTGPSSVAGEALRQSLATESGGALVAERDGRIVVPVDFSSLSSSNNNNKNKKQSLGVVHELSRSGRTAYVEPASLQGPTDQLRAAEAELRQEEARIWRNLTEEILAERPRLQSGVQTVAQLDLARARGHLWKDLGLSEGGAVVPCWSLADDNNKNSDSDSGGTINLKDAKHPVLLLQRLRRRKNRRNSLWTDAPETGVVGSDVSLGVDGKVGLVLTGPNAGGKTVVLKLLGTMALMVQDGIPLPCQSGSTFDYFSHVMADIGDLQSLGVLNDDDDDDTNDNDEGISTFSGHVAVCRDMIEVVSNHNRNPHNDNNNDINDNNHSPKALVLLDEPGGGTDPSAGVAIARAVLEALMDRGARVALTTHYRALKQLADSDADAADDNVNSNRNSNANSLPSRFAVAGMEFRDGRPTYRLVSGLQGESFALEVAANVGLPSDVVDLAYTYLDDDARRVAALLAGLERQSEESARRLADLEASKQALEQEAEALRHQFQQKERESAQQRLEEARAFAQRLQEKEAVLEEVLERLKQDPSRRVVADGWDQIRYVRRDALDEASRNVRAVVASSTNNVDDDGDDDDTGSWQEDEELVPLAEIDPSPAPEVGDTLVVCRPGTRMHGLTVTVLPGGSAGKQGRGALQVNVQGMSTRMKRTELALPPTRKGKGVAVVTTANDIFNNSSKRTNKKTNLSKRTQKMLDEDGLSGGRPGPGAGVMDTNAVSVNVRTESQTLDLRGCTFEEARRKCEDRFARSSLDSSGGRRQYVWLLHGHGTNGILKKRLREWMGSREGRRWIVSQEPASPEDGGDAFTRVRLRPSPML